MSDHRQLIRTANMGLNTDDDLTLIGEDSRYIKNIIFDEDGNGFVASNVLGNTLKNTLGFNYGSGLTFTLPSGTNTANFTLENKEENAVIVFVYNSSGYHSIYQYYKSTDTILWILKGDSGSIGTILNFQSTNQIDAVIIGNQDEKYLIWTDGYNPVRIINIKRAIDYTKGLTTGYTTINADTISFYKKPVANVSFSFGVTVSGGDLTFLLKKIYQVAIRKKYTDGTYSVLSPFSEINILSTEHNPNGIFNQDLAYNIITIGFDEDTGDDVQKYELCYRVVDIGSGVNGFWYLSDLEKASTGTFYVNGEFNGVQLSETTTSRIYDYVPDLSDRIAVIDSNRVILGGITEGYDNLSYSKVVLAHSYDDTTLATFDEEINSHIVYKLGTSAITGSHGGATPNSPTLTPYIIGVDASNVGFKLTNTTKSVSGTITGLNVGGGYYTCIKDDGTNFDWDPGDGFSIDKTTYYFLIHNVPIGRSFCFTKSTHEKYLLKTGSAATTSEIISWDYFPAGASQVATYLTSRTMTGFSISAAEDYVVFTNSSATDFYIDYYAIGLCPKKPSFLSGSKNIFALQYLKNGKPFYATSNKTSDFVISIPTISDAIADDGTKNRELRHYINNVNWQILHAPPSEATHFQWLYLGSDVSIYREFVIPLLSLSPFNEAYTKIPIADLTYFGDAYNVDDYAIEVLQGDRINFIGVFNPDEDNAIYNNIVSFTDDFDFDVINVDDTYIYIRNIGGYTNNMLGGITISTGIVPYIVARVYRRQNLDDRSGIYQAVGSVYEILSNANGYYHYGQMLEKHNSTTQTYFINNTLSLGVNALVGRYIYNKTSGASGIITSNTATDIHATMHGGTRTNFMANDVCYISNAPVTFNPYFAGCFVQKSAFINANNIFTDYLKATNDSSALCYGWTEMQSVSVMYPSLIKYFGRENIINESAKKQYLNKIRWGGQWFDNSGVSFFNKFDFDDSKMLNDANGLITKINQRGDTLKVYQERKATSFYLGTTSSIDANGNKTFVFSSDVMSNGVEDKTDFGCTHFSSFGKDVSSSFFFDIIQGTVIRDSGNGLTDISYKASVYFKEKANAILDYGKDNVIILGGYDDYTKYFFLSFVVPGNLSHAINDTISFDESTNKWRSHYSFLPNYYGTLTGQTLVSCKNGYLYTHNSNVLRNNFYGTQYSSEIWVHGSDQSMLSRLFDSVEITSTGQWSSPSTGDILITYPEEMQSRLVSGKFKKEEGIYRASFLRDMLNGGAATINNLLNGRRLRGHEITCKLKNTDTTQATLKTVIINSTISK